MNNVNDKEYNANNLKLKLKKLFINGMTDEKI